jgi:membrane-bound serine protease (ClpP class)
LRSLVAISVRRLSSVLMLLGLALTLASGARGAEPRVVVLPTTGVVDQVMAGYVASGISRAASSGASAVVIRLNTPGGALDATQSIVSSILDAPVPVIVWVAPAGGRAASAGTFITLAAHVAVMAPGTNIGAASPVTGSGEDIPGTLGEKVKNDAIANITAIAQARGRNVEWAAETVRDARSSPAEEAVEVGAVDAVAASLPEVLTAATGRTVQVAGQPVALSLVGLPTEELTMNPLQSFLHLLADANIAALLFTMGSLGILFELQNPNFVTGVLGAISILLAFIGFGSLPLNVGGLLLLGLGVVLLALELVVASHGLLALAGVICVALGLSALYTEPGTPTAPDVSVAFPVIVTIVALLGVFMVLIVAVAMRTRQLGPSEGTVGVGLPIGTPGEVRSPLGPIGSVYAGGEEWTARSADDRPLGRGTPVRIVRQDGLTVVVEPADPSGSAA